MYLPIIRRRSGFTLIELLTVIVIIAMLAGILFPVMSSAREKARQSKCLNNQRQIALAVNIYAQDHERYPDANWYGALDLGREVLQCPSKPDEDIGYGMNAYLHRARPDTVARPSETICTCDAISSSTLSGDMTRHKKGAIYSRLDGSTIYTKDRNGAGRFAAGQFPLMPEVLIDNQPTLEIPASFVLNDSGTAISRQFLIAGPYGDGTNMGAASVGDLLKQDYLAGERAFAARSGDSAPLAGDLAPELQGIPTPIDTDTFRVFRKWTVVPAVSGNAVRMDLAKNYNAKFPYRTTFAVVYVYSENEQPNTKVTAMIDDGGVVYINGTKVLEDINAGDVSSEHNEKLITLRKGINYVFFRVTNWGGTFGGDPNYYGGMKFNIAFDKPVYVSSSLE